MELYNFSRHTQRSYLSAVNGLAKHYGRSPETISKKMIEDYLLYLKNERKRAPNTRALAVTGLRFFYNHIADKKVSIDYKARKNRRKLPTVLTPEQVAAIISSPANLKHRMLLMTTYSAGLRAGEVTNLKPEHIDSERMLIKIVDGKGRKDRYTMLSHRLLEQLRFY